MEDEICNDGLLHEQRPIPIIETNIETVIASNSSADGRTQAHGNEADNKEQASGNLTQEADVATALGIWKRYLPNTELDRLDVLGQLYKEFGAYKFTNLVEEAAAVGVSNIAELVNLLAKM